MAEAPDGGRSSAGAFGLGGCSGPGDRDGHRPARYRSLSGRRELVVLGRRRFVPTWHRQHTAGRVGAPARYVPTRRGGCRPRDAAHTDRDRLGGSAAGIALGDGETVTCTFTHRALGPPSSAGALQLARRYAPTLRFATNEHYRPLRLDDYLVHSVLRAGSPPGGTITQPKPTLFSLPSTPAASYLDVRGAQPNANAALYPSIEQQLESTTPRPTVYWHVVRQATTGRVAIEYWFMYLYNDFFDKHEADWEGVTVFLQNDTVLGVSYSQHQGRTWKPGAVNTPTVYVARGSHANYPIAGRYAVRVCWTLQGRHCTPTRTRDDASGTGAALAPSAYDLRDFGGTGYTGSWGSGNYILGVGLTKDRIGDPRRRADYTNPFAVIPP